MVLTIFVPKYFRYNIKGLYWFKLNPLHVLHFSFVCWIVLKFTRFFFTQSLPVIGTGTFLLSIAKWMLLIFVKFATSPHPTPCAALRHWRHCVFGLSVHLSVHLTDWPLLRWRIDQLSVLSRFQVFSGRNGLKFGMLTVIAKSFICH